jgi:hypothetical protein
MRLFRSPRHAAVLGLRPSTAAALDVLDAHSDPPAGETPPEAEPLLQAVCAARARLRCPQRRIVFFGAFKTGKSTLINAVIGTQLLPARANRATGVPVTLRYAAAPTAHVTLQANGEQREQAVAFDDFARYVLLDTSGPVAQAPAGVNAVSLCLPLPLLQGGYELVDTPGLFDATQLDECSLRLIEEADLGVMVLAADRLLSEREKAAAQAAAELLGGNLIFAVNRMDTVEGDERDAVLAWAHDALDGLGHTIAGRPPVVATQAQAALGSRDTRRRAGVDELEHCLRAQLDGEHGADQVVRTRLRRLNRRLADLHALCGERQMQEAEHLTSLTHAARRSEQEFVVQQQTQRAEAQAAVAGVVAGLEQRRQDFVEDCVARAGALARAGAPAPSQLNAALQAAARSFTQTLRRDAQSAVHGSGLVVGSFLLEVDGQFSPAQTVIGLGRWIAKRGLGGTLSAAVGNEMRRVATPISRLLQTEAATFLAEIERGLRALPNPEPAPVGDSPEIREAAQVGATWSTLAGWCDAYHAAIAAARQALPIDV